MTDRAGEYKDLRSMIVFQRVFDSMGKKPSSARLHAAMLSLLLKKQEAGEPCPGWVELEQEAKESL